MANEKVIAGLQQIVTDLGQQADGHQLQSRIFASMGFSKLADKYAELTGLDRKVVDKAFSAMKKEGSIVSPVRCKWEPAQK